MHAREILEGLARLGTQKIVSLPFYVQTDSTFSQEDYQQSAVKVLRAMHVNVAIVTWNVTRLVSVPEIKDFFRFLEEAEIFSAEINITHPGSRISMENIQQAVNELVAEEIVVSIVGSVHPLACLAEEVLQNIAQIEDDGVATIPLYVEFSDESEALTLEQYEEQLVQSLLGKTLSTIIFNWNADDEVDVNDIRSWLLVGREVMAKSVMLDASYVGAEENMLTIFEVVKQINDEAAELGGHVDIVMRAESILDIASMPVNGVAILPYGVIFSDEEDAINETQFRKKLSEVLRQNAVSKVIIQGITHEGQTENHYRNLVSDLINGGVKEILFDISYPLSPNNKKIVETLIARLTEVLKSGFKFRLCLDNPSIDSVMRRLEAAVDSDSEDEENADEKSEDSPPINVYELHLSHIIPSPYSRVLCDRLMERFREMLERRGMEYLEVIWDIKFALAEETIRYIFENCGIHAIDIDLRRAGARFSIRNVIAVVDQLKAEAPDDWLFNLRIAKHRHSHRFFEIYGMPRPSRRVAKTESQLRLSQASNDSDDSSNGSEDTFALHRVDSEPANMGLHSELEMSAPPTRAHKSH